MLGLEFVDGQTTYRWYGRHVGDYPLPDGFTADDLGKCDHAIRIPEGHPSYSEHNYEIGVAKRRDGKPGWVLLWDFYAGGFGLQDVVGENCNRLKQAYAVSVARNAAHNNGITVQRKIIEEDGSVRLVCSRVEFWVRH